MQTENGIEFVFEDVCGQKDPGMGDFGRKRDSQPEDTIKSNFKNKHQGLIQYVYRAWADETGVILNPDMFFYTGMSEIKGYIFKNSDQYKHLLTRSDSGEKTKIIVVNLTVDKIVNELEKMVPSKDLFDLVTKTTFTTSPENYATVMSIIMADVCTPFYEYFTTRCGIPKILVRGTREDWKTLLNAVDKLKSLLGDLSYLHDVKNCLENLIKATFDKPDHEFMSKMFIYYNNPKCYSGHLPTVLDGWIKNFYMEKYSSIAGYPSHINHLPYVDLDDPDKRKYAYACSLTSALTSDGYSKPEYEIVHCEIPK